MSDALLLLPDCLLITCGFLLCRFTLLDRSVWVMVERLVYYLLFPALLFISILRIPARPAEMGPLIATGLGTLVIGMVVALGLRRVPGTDEVLHASGSQVAFRFNSFVALTVAERLGGPQGLAWMALLVGVCVPVCNVAAVWPLARLSGRPYGKELLHNPLIISTVAGLAGSSLGLVLPDFLNITLQRIGQAALPLGLMAVGAGLSLRGLGASPALAGALLGIRHAMLPLIALGIGQWLHLSAPQLQLAMVFAALPTASSAYVLAVRMGGQGPFVAGLVTVSTLLGMLSVPAWLALARAQSS